MTSAKDLDIDQLKGMPDVEFDFGVSADVKSAFKAAASKMDGQIGERTSARSHGLVKFEGHFADLFKANGQQQVGDLKDVRDGLKLVATKVGEVEQAAKEENQRRKTALDWAQDHEDRNIVE